MESEISIFKNQLEFRKESGRPEKRYAHSDSTDRPPANIGVKISETCPKREKL